MHFYAYQFMVRENNFNHLLKFRELFHQYITDMYAKIEGERLAYIKFDQSKLRTDSYENIKDDMRNDESANDIGQMYLPSSFAGGPRYMQERQQDAMTYVRKYGKADLFITFTCNPKWKEIQGNLFDGQKNIHRHVITARVFNI